MKYLYLDTSHLQKWVQNELSAQEINLLNKLKKSETTFVFSLMHAYEISDSSKVELIQEIANFIENLPHTWIKNSDERIKDELNYAYQKFLGENEAPRQIFVNRVFDTISPSPDNSLHTNLYLSKKTLNEIFLEFHKIAELKSLNTSIKNRLPAWSKENAKIIKEMNDNHWESEVNKLFKEGLRTFSKKTPTINNKHLDDFINDVAPKPELIKSFSTQFYIMHIMLKNIGKNWDTNDIGDLEHCSSAPYVDVFCCDGEQFSYVSSAKEKFKKLELSKTKIVRNIIDLENT